MSFFIFFIFLVLVVIAIGVFGGRGYQRETLDRMRDIDGRLRRNEETLASLAGLLARLFVPPAETAIQTAAPAAPAGEAAVVTQQDVSPPAVITGPVFPPVETLRREQVAAGSQPG